MRKIIYCAGLAAALFFSGPAIAQSDDKEEPNNRQLSPGMTVQKMGNKDAYKSVLPEGTVIRREGDVRVIEGVGEYAARRFVEYDARLAEMSADIKSLREEVANLRKEAAAQKCDTLVSKPN